MESHRFALKPAGVVAGSSGTPVALHKGMQYEHKSMEDARLTLSAGSLVGDKIVSPDGEKIGKLEEIMIDINDGSVAYAVLSFGGFLGIGDKLFALPWGMLRVDEANKRIVCDISKDALELAPGFDKDNWPDFSSVNYQRQLNDYYAPHTA